MSKGPSAKHKRQTWKADPGGAESEAGMHKQGPGDHWGVTSADLIT